MKKILFVYDHKYPDYWLDGLWAALELLGQEYEIEKLNLGDENRDFPNEADYSLYLAWGSFGSKPDKVVQELNTSQKKAICIAGNATKPDGANNYDVLFYETMWYRDQINFHENIVQAFGVNTDIYNNETGIPLPIIWDYVGVGSFSKWKRWYKMNAKEGNRLVIGEYQKENEKESSEIALDLVREGVAVSNMVHPFDLANIYHWSRALYIPADVNGGGERAILEARACGLEVEIEDDNDKLKELLTGEVPDHHDYAKQLKKGIESCL